MVGVWLIVLASSSTPYGKVPCLILKKTSRRTQAVVVSEGIFCAARCCVIFYLQSMKVYLHMSNGNGQQNILCPAFCHLESFVQQYYRDANSVILLCVCVCCVFFPFILDINFVGRTSQGHTGGRSHRISHPPFCGACLNFSREKDSAVPFPRRP